MSNNNATKLCALDKTQIESLSKHYEIPIGKDQLAQVELHLATLANHAQNLISFTLDEELEPAPEFRP
jgi:hypothetical protein